MSVKDVLAYIDAQPEPKKSTLLAVRETILEIEPKLGQVIARRSAMFTFNGEYVAGLCAHKAHLSFSPQSPDVMSSLEKALEGFVVFKGSFQFAVDQPLPRTLVSQLIEARLKEIK